MTDLMKLHAELGVMLGFCANPPRDGREAGYWHGVALLTCMALLYKISSSGLAVVAADPCETNGTGCDSQCAPCEARAAQVRVREMEEG